MQPDRHDMFSSYLRALPYELLESVTEDYVWLSGLSFREPVSGEFERRRECCRAECLRRGVPHLYLMAEEIVSPWAA